MDLYRIRTACIMLALSLGLTASLPAQDTSGGVESTPSTTSTTSTDSTTSTTSTTGTPRTPDTTGTTVVPPPSPAPDEGAFLPEVTSPDAGIATARGTLTTVDGGFFSREKLVLQEEDGSTVVVEIDDAARLEQLKQLQGKKIEIIGKIQDPDRTESRLTELTAFQEIPAADATSQISPGTPTSAEDPQPPENAARDTRIAPTARTQPLDVEGTAADPVAEPPLATGAVTTPPPPPGTTAPGEHPLTAAEATPPAPAAGDTAAQHAPRTVIGRVMKPLPEEGLIDRIGIATEQGDRYLIAPTGRGADLNGLIGAKVRVIGHVVETAQLQQPPQPAVVQDDAVTEQVTGDHEEKARSLTAPALPAPDASTDTAAAVPPVKDAAPDGAIDEVGTGAEPPAAPLGSAPQDRGIPAAFQLSFKDAKTLEVESFQVLEMAQGQELESPAVPLDTGALPGSALPDPDVQPETTRQTLDEKESTGI